MIKLSVLLIILTLIKAEYKLVYQDIEKWMQCSINAECTDEFVGNLCCTITVIGGKPTAV